MIENKPPVIKPEQIPEIILRRRWFIIIPLLIASVCGSYLAVVLPKSYRASTSILVQAQRVPGNYVKSIVSTSIESRIGTISQQILSRSNLEKIIKEFNLFAGPDYQNMFVEEKVQSLRGRIAIKTSRKRSGSDAFTISFKGKNPEKVKNITNTLATFFMDENLKLREAQAVGTSDFLQSELEKTRKRLEEHEKRVSEYRMRHLGSLPEELDTNLRALDRLQIQLSARQTVLIDAKIRLGGLEALKNSEQSRKISSIQLDEGEDISPSKGSETELKLKKAQQQFENMSMRYTSRHPGVVRLTHIIKNLEVKHAKELQEATVSVSISSGAKRDLSLPVRTTGELQQIREIRFEIAKLKSDIKKIEKKMQFYQKKVEATPKREQELLSLNRDYSNVIETYNSLLSRKLEAEISVNMEKKQKGEQFRVLDSARLPQKPISPNIKKILVFSIALGLGIGCGIVFLLEFFDTSFRTTQEVEEYLDLPVLATVPVLSRPGDALKRRGNLVLSVGVLGVSACFILFLTVLSIKGIDQTMAFVGKYIKI